MKISNLIGILTNIKEDEGDLTVYVIQPDWDNSVEDPQVRLVEGGDYCRPYPGLYLN